jgi:probable phosphoglycerate mutase
MPTRVLLVRHGQSEWNAVGRWQGQADPPLSELGRRQALAAVGALRELGGFDAVFASDLQRAAGTAALIAAELGVAAPVLLPDLRERDAGEWSGLTRDEIHERYPGFLPDDRHRAFAPGDDDRPRRPPGWEPDESVLRRAKSALATIDSMVGDGTALAVTHGGLVYVVEGLLGAPFERLANAGGRWVHVEGDRLVLDERVLLVDDDDVAVTVPKQL